MRTTDDPKDMVIKVRVNAETREQLKTDARQNGIGVSELIRNIIKDHYKNFSKK